MIKTPISTYINKNYREYSIYTNNERAIPSNVDGFKPVQRKAIFCAIKDAKNAFVKVSSLAGSLPRIAAYHHGTTSAEDAIISLTQDFNNNIPFLEGDGTFGTRLSPTAGAARYIFSKLSTNFDKIFKDIDIMPYSDDLDDHPEPLYYLPIIPTVLLNGIKGIAVGFATNIAPRSHVELSKTIIQILEGKRITSKLLPYYASFNGDIEDLGNGKYLAKGKYQFVGKSKYNIEITEIPMGKSHEQYIALLDKLKEEKKINSYVDESENSFHFFVNFPQTKNLTHEYIMKTLSLEEKIHENIVVVDEFNKHNGEIGIRVYDNPLSLIKDFTEFRLGYYNKRIDHKIHTLNTELKLLQDKYRFIHEVINKTILLDTMTRTAVVEYLTDSPDYSNENISKISTLSMFSMTLDSLEKLQTEIDNTKKLLDDWKSYDPKDLYIADLKELISLK